MPFLPSNQQRQSTEGTRGHRNEISLPVEPGSPRCIWPMRLSLGFPYWVAQLNLGYSVASLFRKVIFCKMHTLHVHQVVKSLPPPLAGFPVSLDYLVSSSERDPFVETKTSFGSSFSETV